MVEVQRHSDLMGLRRKAWRRPEPPQEWRWRCGLRESRWFKSKAAAENSAVRSGLAWREGERLLLGPLVSIECRAIG